MDFMGRQCCEEMVDLLRRADEVERLKLIDVIHDWTQSSSLISESGFELLYAPLWELVFLKHDRTVSVTKILTILTGIIRLNPNVNFGSTLADVVGVTMKGLCSINTDLNQQLAFIDALIQYAYSNARNIQNGLNSFLQYSSSQLLSACDVWKYVLLSTRALFGLQSTAFKDGAVPTWIGSFAELIVAFIQSKSTNQSPIHRALILNLSLALTTFSGRSLDWVRCRKTNEEIGRTFTGFITSVTVELILQFNRMETTSYLLASSKTSSNLTDVPIAKLIINPLFTSDSDDFRLRIIVICLTLLRSGLCELMDDVEDYSEAKPRLATYVNDQSIQSIWRQLSDLEETIQTWFNSLQWTSEQQLEENITSSSLVTLCETVALDNTSTSCPILQTAVCAVLTYLNWLELYFWTHCAAVASTESKMPSTEADSQLTKLWLELISVKLKPMNSKIMHPVLKLYVSFPNLDRSGIRFPIEEWFSSLSTLSELFAGYPLFEHCLSLDSSTGTQLSRWLQSRWQEVRCLDEEMPASNLSVLGHLMKLLTNSLRPMASNTVDMTSLDTWLMDSDGFVAYLLLRQDESHISDVIVTANVLSIQLDALFLSFYTWLKVFQRNQQSSSAPDLLSINIFTDPIKSKLVQWTQSCLFSSAMLSSAAKHHVEADVKAKLFSRCGRLEPLIKRASVICSTFEDLLKFL